MNISLIYKKFRFHRQVTLELTADIQVHIEAILRRNFGEGNRRQDYDRAVL